MKKYYKKTSQIIPFFFTIVFLVVFIICYLQLINITTSGSKEVGGCAGYTAFLLISLFSYLLTLSCSLRAAKSKTKFIMAFGVIVSICLGIMLILVFVIGFGYPGTSLVG